MKTTESGVNFKALLDDIANEKHDSVARKIDALVEEAGMSIAYILVTKDGVVERVMSRADPFKLLGGVASLMWTLQKDCSESGQKKPEKDE
jgi:hypothetical protein